MPEPRFFILIRTTRPVADMDTNRVRYPFREWETYSVGLPESVARAMLKHRRGMYDPGDLMLVREIE